MILDAREGVETRAELADVLGRLFERVSPASDMVTRADAAAAGGFDTELWSRLNGEVGVLSLTVPEELGGAGAGIAEVAVLVELVGRRVAAVPFLGSFLAVEALVRAGEREALDRWLEPLIGGGTRAAVCWSDGLRAEQADTGWSVSGFLATVIDGDGADLLVAPATTHEGVRWFAVDATSAPASRCETLDLARDVTRRDVAAAPAILLDVTDPEAFGAALHDLATLLLAVDQLGVAEQCVADAVAYAKVREQFGRPIGSFQALKHLVADMAVEADLARSLVEHALWVATERPERLREAAAMAMLAASGAAVTCSAENVQVHGGIGFSWENPAHLYFRRARSNEVLLAGRPELVERVLAPEFAGAVR